MTLPSIGDWDSDDYRGAVDVLINRRLRKVDVGVFGYYDGQTHVKRYFLNAVYIGLGARIVIITNETRRFWGIPLFSYLSSLFLVAFERKLYRMHLKVNDEHIRGRLMAVAIGSARGYGLTPSAVPYNGWLDVSLIYRPELRQLVSGLWMLQQGRLLNHKTVKPYRTRQVKNPSGAKCRNQSGRACLVRPSFPYRNNHCSRSLDTDNSGISGCT